MRHDHEPVGLIEVTRSLNVLKRWALSLHLCSRLIKDITAMRNESESQDVIFHIKESGGRIESDVSDRGYIREKLT
jgi:hypothetical protein